MRLIYTLIFCAFGFFLKGQTNLSKGLEAHYDLTTSTADQTTNGWDGKLLGNAKFISQGLYTGPSANATNAMSIPHQVLDSAEDFSIYARIYLESYSGDVTTLISGYDKGDQLEFSFSNRSVRVIVADDEKNYFNYSLPLMQWHQVVLLRRNGHLRFAVDTSFDDSSAVKQQAMKIGNNALIFGHEQDREGGGFNTGTCFNGYINSLRIYRRALTDKEMDKLIDGKFTGLVQRDYCTAYQIKSTRDGLLIETNEAHNAQVLVVDMRGCIVAQTELRQSQQVQVPIPATYRQSFLIVRILDGLIGGVSQVVCF